MRKSEELTNPASCMSRAREDEMTFVLLGRDRVAAWAIRIWCALRWLVRKNRFNDPQITEALDCADAMDRDRAKEAKPNA